METAVLQQTVVKIPLDQILVLPEDNPRGPYPRQEVEEMALSLKLGGQEVPVLLRPRAPEEKSQAHPDRPYKLVGGYLRYAAAPLAGLAALDAIVRDMTPRQARRSAILDNVRKDMHWLAWGEAAESLLADDPDMTIQDAADLIGQNRTKVSRAQKLLKVLSKPARDAIRANCTTPGGFDLPEACALCLGDLATGGEGDQALIERAVKVAIDRRLTLEKAKKLVVWVKKGGQPEDFGQKEPKVGPEDPLAAYWPQLGPGFKVKFKGGEDYDIHIRVQGGHKAWDAALAASRTLKAHSSPGPMPAAAQLPPVPKGDRGGIGETHPQEKGGQSLLQKLWFFLDGHLGHGKLKAWLGGGLLGVLFGFLAPNLKRVLGLVVRRYMVHILVALGVAGYVGSRMYGNHRVYSQPRAVFQPQAVLTVPTPNSSLLTSNSPNGAPTPNSPLLTPNSPKVDSLLASNSPNGDLSKADKRRVQQGADLAAGFAPVFYGLSYKTFSDWGLRVGAPIYMHYFGALLRTFFPNEKLKTMQNRKLVESFQPTQLAKVVGVDRHGETILVKGTAILQSDLTSPGQLVAEGPVALEIHVSHAYPDHPEGKIDHVLERTALDYDWMVQTLDTTGQGAKSQNSPGSTPAPTKSQGGDLLGNTLSNVAGQGVSAAAGEAIKKLLPF